MRPLRIALLALPMIPAFASAQEIPVLSSFGFKLGYSQSDLPGVMAGIDFKVPMSPIRLDADVWGSLADFGKKSGGTALTANYVKSLPLVYFGAGAGYAYGIDRSDHFNQVAGKVFLGGKIPLLGTGLEGSLIFAKRTVFGLTAVWRF
jgi:hypothetical protein